MATSNSVILNRLSFDYFLYVLLNIYWFARSALLNPSLLFCLIRFNLVPFPFECRNVNQTLELLLHSEKSFVRLGDGDLALYFFHWKKWWSKRVRIGYYSLLCKPKDNLILGIPDVITSDLTIRPNVNASHLRLLSFYFASLMSRVNHCYGSSFAFRKQQYIPRELSINLLEYFFRLTERYDDVIIVCDVNSSLNDFHSTLKKEKKLVKPILITVPSEWNVISVDNTLNKIARLRDKNREQLVLLSYGHVARWASFDMINIGFRIIDVGQISFNY